jgi:Tol biopolymer transport system component
MVSKKMEIRDLMRLRMISDPQISPDGKQIAFVNTRIDYSSNDYLKDIWLADTDTMKSSQFTSGRGKDSYPRWSPDGSRLLFLSSTQDKDQKPKNQLFIIDLAGGEARQLTKMDGGVRNPKWSSNSRRILFTSLIGTVEEKTDVKVIKRLQYRYNAKGYFDGKRSHLFTIPTDGTKARQLTEGEFDVETAEWIDGRTIAFLSNIRQVA